MNEENITNRLDKIELALREISDLQKQPHEQLNLMQLRVAAYRKIKSSVALIDRLLEIVETEFITEAPSISDEEYSAQVIFLNKQQEEQHNQELHEVVDILREIRWILTSPPENYQNATNETGGSRA